MHLYDYIQIILLYVDDILIIVSCIIDIGSIMSSLHNAFSMTGLGLLKQFIELDIEQYDVGIKFSQSKYASYLLFNFKMDECKASKFPFLSRFKLGDFCSSQLVDNLLYRKLVGSLLYLTHSRTDLDYCYPPKWHLSV